MSLKAIAKELGLSVTTVSRALNGYDDVSAETRARVEAEAQRRGYRPNTFARRLKMGKIDAVGLVFPVHPVPLNNSVFMDMVGEISHELARHEIDLLLIADDDLADKHSYMRMVQSRRVDALIVAHTLDHDPRLEQLQAAGFPFLGARPQPAPAAVRVVRFRQLCRHISGHPLADRERPSAHCAAGRKATTEAFITQRRQWLPDALREARTFQRMAACHAPFASRGVCHHARTSLPAAAAHGHHYRLQHPRRRRSDGPRRRWGA